MAWLRNGQIDSEIELRDWHRMLHLIGMTEAKGRYQGGSSYGRFQSFEPWLESDFDTY